MPAGAVIITAGAPGVIVWPPITYSEALFAEKVCEPMTKGGGAPPLLPAISGKGRRGIVLSPTMMLLPPEGTLTGVPPIEMAEPPGRIV